MSKIQLLESLKKAKIPEKIIEAFSKVKREDFLPDEIKSMAYTDNALPIGYNQTISQPYTIGIMLSLMNLKKNQKVLEIGSGSGYVLALISEIVGENGRVYGVEVIRNLADKSVKTLKSYRNVSIRNINGKDGLPESAPFDKILISAALQEIPKTILSQLVDGGILVAPLGQFNQQSLVAIKRSKDYFFKLKEIPGFVFVKFV